MRRFQIYGVSSTLIVAVIGLGIILYLVFNDIMVFLVWFLAAAFGFILISALLPRFYRQMSQTVELRDTALNSRKSEIAGLICDECKKTGALLEQVGGELKTDSEKSELNRLGQELASMKCCSAAFEVQNDELGAVDLTFLTTRAAEVRDRLGAIKRSAADKYSPLLKRKDGEREAGMKELLSAGYGMGELYAKFEGLSSRHTSTLEELVEKEQEMDSLITETDGEATKELERLLSTESGRKGFGAAGTELEKLKASDSNFPEKAKALASLRKRLQGALGSDFSSLRDSILSSMSSTSSAAKGDALSDFREKLATRIEAVRQLNDPGSIHKLRTAEQEYREFVDKYLEDISTKTRDMRKELLDYKPPKEMLVKLPSKLETPKGSLAEFTKRLCSLLSEISPGLDELYRNVKVMRSYQKVERLIDFRLEENGKVYARDLDIRHPEVFFALYRKKHPRVRFIQSPEPKLVSG